MKSSSALALLVVGIVALLVAVPPAGRPFAVHTRTASTDAQSLAAAVDLLPKLSDGGVLQGKTGLGVLTTLTDSISYGPAYLGSRSYTITVTASIAVPLLSVGLFTSPVTNWQAPNSFPAGADNLPSLWLWNWKVLSNGKNDSTNWSTPFPSSYTHRTISWVNASYTVVGSTSPTITATVDPGTWDGTHAPGVGFVLNAPQFPGSIPNTDSDFASLAQALHPSTVRIGTDVVGMNRGWDSVNHVVRLNFTDFDRVMNFAHQIHAGVLLTLSAGTWGDGNLFPAGTPVNTSVTVTGPVGSGYFLTDSAWASWIRAVVNHTYSATSNIAYWSIGNEVPATNQTEVTAYVNIFNIASKWIHATYPSALVGSDNMANQTFETYFAAHANKVGFLSVHYYPSIGLCFTTQGAYCPPAGQGKGSQTPFIWAAPAYLRSTRNFAPLSAQGLWHNKTGQWLPELNAETNLGATGGSLTSYSTGTDPRQQTVMGAAWAASLMVDSANENISVVNYYTLTGPSASATTATWNYGGWGFGLSSEGTSDNDTLFAPYWALKMWASAIPAGAAGRATTLTGTGVIQTYSALNHGNLSVVIVNKVQAPVTVSVKLSQTGWKPAYTQVLDKTTYWMNYSASKNATTLSKSTVRTTLNPTSASVKFMGYGVGLVEFVKSSNNSSGGTPISPGNGTNGSGSSSSPPNGNSSGNSSASPNGTSGLPGNSSVTSNGTAGANSTSNESSPPLSGPPGTTLDQNGSGLSLLPSTIRTNFEIGLPMPGAAIWFGLTIVAGIAVLELWVGRRVSQVRRLTARRRR